MQTERQNTFTFAFVEIEMNCNIQLWLLIGPIMHIITLTLSRTQRCKGTFQCQQNNMQQARFTVPEMTSDQPM